MPTRAKKSQSAPSRKGLIECASSSKSDSSPCKATTLPQKDCSCECDNHPDPNEWEIDSEELLHVEINGIFQDILPSHESNDTSRDSSNDFVRFLGLDSSEPIAQIGGIAEDEREASSAAFFSGHYENTVGTSTFFTLEESNLEENGVKSDPVFVEESEIPPTKKTRYICKADKKLVLKRVFLNKKPNPDAKETINEETGGILQRQVLQSKFQKVSAAGPSAAPSDVQNK